MQKTRHFDRIGKSIQQYYADGGASVTSDTGRCPAAPSARRQIVIATNVVGRAR
jgi:hypothetical protein